MSAFSFLDALEVSQQLTQSLTLSNDSEDNENKDNDDDDDDNENVDNDNEDNEKEDYNNKDNNNSEENNNSHLPKLCKVFFFNWINMMWGH